MTRTVSSTISNAVAQDVTKPIYLIRMDFTVERRSCTWDVDITWDSETWTAGGLAVSNLDSDGGTLRMPMGDDDPWLDLVTNEALRSRAIEIYEYQTDYTASPIASDAVLIFSGLMDEAIIGKEIRVKLIENKRDKAFPPTSINESTYNFLLPTGTVIIWRDSVITAD